MTDRNAIDTILLPIDAHGVSRAELDTLMRMARQLDCRLLGLFVEDTRLQQVADLPFTTEVVLVSGGERDLHPQRLRSRFGKISSDTRTALEELARRNRVQLAWDTAEGARLHSAMQRAADVNVFLPGRALWSGAPTRRARPAAIPRLGVLLNNPVDDSHVLAMATALVAGGLVGAVHILLPGAADSARLRAIAQLGPRAHLMRIHRLTPQGVTELIRRAPYDLQLLPLSSLQDIPPQTLEAALDACPRQVLVVS